MNTPTPNETPAKIDVHEYPENATPIEMARYRVAVADAHERGESIECTPEGVGYSRSGRQWMPAATPRWAFNEARYRVARPKPAKIADGLPKPKVLTPWTLNTVPKRYLLVREKGETGFDTITSWGKTGLRADCLSRTWDNLAEVCEHSTDGENWLPCGVES